ncbi:MAG: hypothetical protein ABSC26_02645, partial [Stellaceae bacterium]
MTSRPRPDRLSRIACGARNIGVGIDDEGQRALHVAEGVDHLHQPAELDRLGKIARCHHHHREDHRQLGIARGEPVQELAPFHDLPVIGEDVAEAAVEHRALGRLAAVERDALGVFAQAHQAVAEIGLKTLLREIQRHQRPADLDREPGAEPGIDQRRPGEIGRDVGGAERPERDVRRPGEPDQDHHERNQRHDGGEHAQRQRHHVFDEQPQIVGYPLVGVVGGAAGKLHAEISALGEPAREITPGEPAAPADL